MCVNKFCWCGTIKDFLDLDPAAWLEQMKSAYPHVSPYPLSDSQVAAWADSCAVLHRALPALKPGYENLHLIFEYGLPYRMNPETGDVADRNRACYADCIVVSNAAVVVLEFKQFSEPLPCHAWEAVRYRNRLQRYHDQSWGKRKWGILVPTHSTGLRERVYRQVNTPKGPIEKSIPRITACSPDRLAEELEKQLGRETAPSPVGSIVQWRESEYSYHRPLT